MIENEESFAIKVPIQKAWDFISDINKITSCLPGLEKAEQIDENTADLTIKQKMGIIPFYVKIRNTITEKQPPNKLVSEGSGEHLEMVKLTLELKETSASETEVHYKMQVEASGNVKSMVEYLMNKKQKEQTEQFVAALKQKLE
ncbi:MAG: CoxG family protein [Nitrososphaerales archaeon]